MKKRKRNAIGITYNPIRSKISRWCYNNKNELFNIPILTDEIGLDSNNYNDRTKVYNHIVYWRNKFKDFYFKQKKAGVIDDMNRYEAWDTMLYNYNQNDAYVFLSKYDTENRCHYFVQPGFDMLENMDKQRLNKQWKGIQTIMDEMKLEDARLILSDGTRKPISDLLEAGKNVGELLGDGNAEST